MQFVLTMEGWGPCLDLFAVEERFRFLIINYQTNNYVLKMSLRESLRIINPLYLHQQQPVEDQQ
jgi:hypothetical protein